MILQTTPVAAPFKLPLPVSEEGWSRSVMRVTNALVEPGDGSVWTNGVPCPEAMHYRWSGPYRGNRSLAAPQSFRRISGRHLWGGTIFFHFGHFLAESLTRLWAAADSGAQSVIFTPKSLRGKQPEHLVGYQKAVLSALGINLPVQILYEPAMVEDLIIPGQGFGLGALDRGTPEFRSFVRHMDPGPDPDREGEGRKIYISRTALPKKTGSILGEAELEQMLSRQGFEIYHPQQHSIPDQIRTFRNARHLVGPDGSAFHLAAFVSQPDQTFTIIKRRTAKECDSFLHQLEAMNARASIIDVLRANWLKPGKKDKPDDRSWGEIDFVQLSDELKARGLIDSDLGPAPSYTEELARIGVVNRGDMVRQAV